MIKQTFGALFIGIVIVLLLAPYSSWFCMFVGQRFCHEFEKAGHCTVQVQHVRCSVLPCSITLEDITVAPSEGKAWSWSAKKYSTSFSLFELFAYGVLDMQIHCVDVHVDSACSAEENVAITPHILGLMQESDLGIKTAIKEVVCDGVVVHVHDDEGVRQATLGCHVQVKRIGTMMKGTVQVYEGAARDKELSVLYGLHGMLQCSIPLDKSLKFSAVTSKCSAQVPFLPDAAQPLYLTASWERGRGQCNIVNSDSTIACSVYDCIARYDDLTTGFKLSLPLRYLAALNPDVTSNAVGGVCDITGSVRLSETTSALQARCRLRKTRCLGIKCGGSEWSVQFNRSGPLWKGSIHTVGKTPYMVKGTMRFDMANSTGNIAVHNTMLISPSCTNDWCMRPREGVFQGSLTPAGFEASYSCSFINRCVDATRCLQGTMSLHDEAFALQGSWCGEKYQVVGSTHTGIERATYSDRAQQSVIQTHARVGKDRIIDIAIDVPFISQKLKEYADIDLHGNGTLKVAGKYGQRPMFKARLEDGAIRLPGTYNFIRKGALACTIEPATRTISIAKGSCILDKGKITFDGGRCVFDDDGISFMHMPLLIDRCVFNINRDMFAAISGAFIVRKEAGKQPIVTGNLLLDQAHLEGNIFSEVLQNYVSLSVQNIFANSYPDLMCDITCESLEPLCVRTAFLSAQCAVDLGIKGALQSPTISGSVSIINGSLFFPYKPLHITRGIIRFAPDQSNDPLIELVARNRIKKHDVSLQVTGSVRDNTILLNSSPSLSEEQIIALLLVGSQQESLNVVVPALIVQNLTGLLFNQKQSPLDLSSSFQKLLKPFKYVYFVPSFTDQTGRGGLRATFEIDVNDRLSALIQKNFNLTEDTRFEVEYAVSDDISVRGIRNERRDIGGEVEFRWKF